MRLAAVVALLAAAPPALAEVPTPVAVELSRIALPRQNWEQVIAASRDQVDQTMPQAMAVAARQGGIQLPDDYVEMVRSQTQDLMTQLFPTYEEMLDFQAGLLQKHYTADELKELLAFYQSPLGQKAIRITPEVMRDAMGWMQARVQQQMPAAMERMMASLKAYAAEHPPKKGAPAPKKATRKP